MSVVSLATIKAQIQRAMQGDLNALGHCLRAIARNEAYTTYAGTPNGNLTPEAIGQRAQDTTNKVWYIASDLTNTGWVLDGTGGGINVTVGATLAVTAAAHLGRNILLAALAGSIATLPAATGTGNRYRFLVSVLATSNSHIVKAAGTDVMIGAISGARIDAGNAVLGFAAQSTSNTITLNRTTTGSVSLGEYIEVADVAAGIWETSGFLTATGAAFATPYSHV